MWVGCCLAPVRVLWVVACCARSPGWVHPAAVAAWHLSVCLGCGRRRASLACLLAPRGAPRLVRSGRSRCSGRLSRRRGAFTHPGGLRPRLHGATARGTRRPAKNRALCACRWPPPRRGRWARSASNPFGAPRWGCPWRVPPALVLGCVRCGGWRVWTRSLTRPVSRTVRRSTGDSAGAPGLFRVEADTAPCGSEDATPGFRACVCVLALLGRVGRAGLPGALWCASLFHLLALTFCFAWPPLGWGCPCHGPSFPSSVAVFRAPPLSPALFGFRPWVPWALALCVVCPVRLALLGPPCALAPFVLPAWLLVVAWWLPSPPPFVSRGFSCRRSVPCVLSFLVRAPVVSRFLWFRAPGALGLGAVLCVFFPPPLGFLFLLGRWLLLGAWCPPPPFICVWLVSSLPLGAPPPFFLSLRAPMLSLAFSGFRPRVPWALALCFVCFVGLPLLSSPCAPSFFCVLPGGWLLPGGCCPPPLPLGAPFFFFSLPLRCAPPLSPTFPGFRPMVPWAWALRVVFFVGPPLLGLRAFSPLSCLPSGRWLPPGGCCPSPPFLCLAVFVASARCCVPCVVLCCVSRVAVLRCAAARCVTRCCAVVCCVVLLRLVGAAARRPVPSGAPRHPGALCFAALCFAVFPRAVCILLLRGGVRCCSPLCFVLCVSWGAVLCVPCPLRSVRCCASLCWCACVVLFVWCVLLLAPGAVVRCRVLCCFLLVCSGAVLGLVARGCLLVPCCGALLSVFFCWWCWFVSFPCVCGAVLRCASCCLVPVESALLSVPRAVVCPCVLWCLPGRSAVCWCRSGVSWCLAVLCVVLWCPAPCALSCGAVLPCGDVLVGCAVRLSALLVFVFPFVLFSFAKNPCCFSVPLKTF